MARRYSDESSWREFRLGTRARSELITLFVEKLILLFTEIFAVGTVVVLDTILELARGVIRKVMSIIDEVRV